MFRSLMRMLDGRTADLDARERRRFFVYAYRSTGASRTALTFGMPLLFLIGWARDFVVQPEGADAAFTRRALLFGTLIALALLVRLRRLGYWAELALVAYACAFSAGISMTTLADPQRLSLMHVIAVLMVIILLPFALHRSTLAALVVVFFVPLFAVLARLQAPLSLWWAYLAYGVVGIGIGLAYRRSSLDASLDVFQLRQRLLSRLQLDSLTDVLNRDGWQAHGERLFEQCRREGRPVSVAYFDLDHFKQINDTHGHAEGDEVLRATATLIRQHTRPECVIARPGGEEFLALLPDTDEDGAFQYAGRIRAAVRAMDGPVTTTISGGVAEARADDTLVQLVARADAAMLEAKRRGRNRILRPGGPAAGADAMANDDR